MLSMEIHEPLRCRTVRIVVEQTGRIGGRLTSQNVPEKEGAWKSAAPASPILPGADPTRHGRGEDGGEEAAMRLAPRNGSGREEGRSRSREEETPGTIFRDAAGLDPGYGKGWPEVAPDPAFWLKEELTEPERARGGTG